jgi:BTB/POZ domain
MSQHAMASSPQFMYVYYEDKIYRYDILNQTWHKLKKSLKSPRIKGQCTMQLVDKYLYLVGNTHDGPEVYRLNLEKAWLWVPGDSMVDYSVIDKQSFYNHQPTSDVLIKIGDNKIYAHRKVLCKFSNLLKRQLNKGIKTISISEFPAIVMQILVEQLYSDCTLELPREMSTLLQLFRASHWLDVEDLDNKCLKSLNVSASNLRYVVELVGDIPEVRTKCLEYVKNHLKEAALILAADQLSGLLK